MSKQLIALFAILLSSVIWADTPGPLLPKPHDGYEIKDNKIYFRKGNGGMILEVADHDSIAKYYSDRGSSLGDPFPTLAPELEHATIFIMTLINKTKKSFTFTPNYAELASHPDAWFVLDFTALLPMLDDVDDHTKQILQNSIFHSPETIKPGDTVTKFLIFPDVPTKKENLELKFSYMFVEDRELNQSFYFTRKKKQ